MKSYFRAVRTFGARIGFPILGWCGILLLLFCSLDIYAQTTDCPGASPQCQGSSININNQNSGFPDFALSGNNDGCLSGENQSAWFVMQVDEGGTLGFDIRPNRNGDDFDFAVWGPNRPCDNLGNPIRCDYSAPTNGGATGMNGNQPMSNTSNGGGGDGYVYWLEVNPGDVYIFMVDNFSTSQFGFTLNFSGTATLDCSITQDCPTVDLGPDQAICDGQPVTLTNSMGPQDDFLWSTGETTQSITVSQSGIYWLEVDRDGCIERDSIELSIATTPEVDLGNDTILCAGSSLELNVFDPAISDYTWNDGTIGPTYTVIQTGTYEVTISNGTCPATDDIEVTFLNTPDIELGPDTTLCNTTSYALDATSTDADTYLWQDGSTSPILNATTSGTYIVLLSNAACSSGDTIALRFGDTPVFPLPADTSQCEGGVLVLNATTAFGANYTWQDSTTDAAITVDSTNTYVVEISNAECSTIGSVTATFLAYPEIDLGPDTTLCNGDATTLSATSTVATNYLWSDGSTDATLTTSNAGTYAVTATNDFCPSADSVVITLDDAPFINLRPDTILCREVLYPLTLSDTSGYDYLWQDNSNASSFEVFEDGEYYVVASNQCGSVSDTVTVTYGSCNCDFFLPKAFTPNGDGLNDRYRPLFNCDSLQSYNLEIFDRYGGRLFSSDDPQEAFEADSRDRSLPMDGYVWVLEYRWTWRGMSMERRESGFFSILR